MRTDQSVSGINAECDVPRVLRYPRGLPSRVVALWGEYDASNADALWDRLTRVIDADDVDLVLDLGAVSFLDASTLTVFIKAKAALDRESRRFALRSLSIPAVRIVEICGLRCLVEDAFGTSQAS